MHRANKWLWVNSGRDYKKRKKIVTQQIHRLIYKKAEYKFKSGNQIETGVILPESKATF